LKDKPSLAKLSLVLVRRAAVYSEPFQRKATPSTNLVGSRVTLQEVQFQRQIKLAGGKWNPTQRVWELRYDQAVRLK
jgi:hypothetical protein